MNSIMKKAAITLATAAAAIGIGIAPAAASVPFAASGSATFTSGTISISCPAASLMGTSPAATITAPAQVAAITSSTWSGCTYSTLPLTVSQSGTWVLWANGASGGVASVEIRSFNVTLSIPSLGCTIHFAGTAPGTFTNSTQMLSFAGGALTASGSGFCLGLGTTGSLNATYHVTSPAPLTIL
jgi:hypothetical protein